MAIDLQSALDRLCAIEKEALAALSTPVTADAVPYMMHQQESFPYFTHRMGTDEVDRDSQSISTHEAEIVIRLVVGHIQEGYRGQPEGTLYAYIPVLIAKINARARLQSATYTTALTGLVDARVTSCAGLRIYETAGIQVRQVGTEFTVVCSFVDDLTQDYL